MEDASNPDSVDLIRWTFTIDPARRAQVEEYLTDLGLEVLVRDDAHVSVSWDEPEGNLDEVIEGLWEVHGEPFEITQEEFHRQSLVRLQYEEDDTGAERAVA